MNTTTRREVGSPVGLVITLTAMAATVAFAVLAPSIGTALRQDPARVVEFLALTLALQLFSVRIYGGGRIGVSAIGMLASGFALGPGPAAGIAAAAAMLAWIHGRGLVHRALFDAAQFALAAGVAAASFQGLTALDDSTAGRVGAAFAAGVVFAAINNGLLCLVLGVAESRTVRAIWIERFRWARYHYLAFGPLALACVLANDSIGIAGLVAFALPPALLLLSVQQYVERTRLDAERVARMNEELRVANANLAARNADLRSLFDLAGGLGARTHDRPALIAYAEDWVSRATGATARIRVGEGSGGIDLVVGGEQVGTLSLVAPDGSVADRWTGLGETAVPQLATAIESADAVERVRRTHLATIAALSRSMEAKDYYTGGHTERVAEIAMTLASELGYEGADLEAIQIGSLLHDIGKIGVPERILQKPGALEEDEWEIMRRHPVISDYILSEIELHPIVRQIARSSHERIDGAGYPDGLSGSDVPLPARIVLVADAYDAMTSDRPYRSALSVEDALAELHAKAGTQFCPVVVQAFERARAKNAALFAPVELQPASFLT